VGGYLRKLGMPEYLAWRDMKQRCYNPNNGSYKYYGFRGIIVCERWLHSFNNFLEDIGYRPSPAHSLDRINNDGNYEPKNCRWATRKEQAHNTRRQRNMRIKMMWELEPPRLKGPDLFA
jgi:hypothetical protein